jgi:hypothetical protein
MMRCPFNNCEECTNCGKCELNTIPPFFLHQVEPIYNESGLIVDVKLKDV